MVFDHVKIGLYLIAVRQCFFLRIFEGIRFFTCIDHCHRIFGNLSDVFRDLFDEYQLIFRDLFKVVTEYFFESAYIFDQDVREPSPAPGFIPYDLPQAGRQVYFEARYSY